MNKEPKGRAPVERRVRIEVNMHYIEKLRRENDHALDRLFVLFKDGIHEELKLKDKIDTLQDEIRRIKVCAVDNEEIIGLCDRALKNSSDDA